MVQLIFQILGFQLLQMLPVAQHLSYHQIDQGNRVPAKLFLLSEGIKGMMLLLLCGLIECILRGGAWLRPRLPFAK